MEDVTSVRKLNSQVTREATGAASLEDKLD